MSRIFRTFTEAEHEIKRELAERSILVQPETMQDKVVAENSDFLTKEMQNFQYTVTQPDLTDLSPTQPWADIEFKERVLNKPASRKVTNPGNAWRKRREVWAEFLEPETGHFSYTYPQRLDDQIEGIIKELGKHPNSRQLWLSIWDKHLDPRRRGERRVPCSLGYYFLFRQNKLDITYAMRSCDFMTHWNNDVWLARKTQEYVAMKAGMEPGNFSQIVFSLHVYQKDVADVF